MLDPHEKLAFDRMVNELRDEDPRFVHRVEKHRRPRRKVRRAVAIALWTLAPVCMVLGGWTGLLMAVVAVGYGAFLVAKPRDMDGQPAGRSSSNRRPGAPSF